MKKTALLLALCFTAALQAQAGPATTTGVPTTPPEARSHSLGRSPVREGPFGVWSGMSFAELDSLVKLSSEDNGLYSANLAPEPHPTFKRYLYFFVDGFGLCSVTALTAPIKSNDFGDGVVATFKTLASALESKYGKPSVSFDFVRSGSAWREPSDWLTSLEREDRKLEYTWIRGTVKGVKEKNMARLPDHLAYIELKAASLRKSDFRVVLQYAFEKVDACLEKDEKARNKPL